MIPRTLGMSTLRATYLFRAPCAAGFMSPDAIGAPTASAGHAEKVLGVQGGYAPLLFP